MEILNKHETKNPLFRRKEVKFEIKTDIAPKREDVQKLISEKFSCKPEVIRINIIKGVYGTRLFKVEADIYDSADFFKKYVRKSKKELESEKKALEQKKEVKESKEEAKE